VSNRNYFAAIPGNLHEMNFVESISGFSADINLSFDAVGNLATRTRQVQVQGSLSVTTLAESFTYDQLNRLTQINTTGHATQTLSYDLSGNITSKSGVGSYTYNPSRPHAVASAGGDTFTYDAIGNMLSGGGRAVTYNAFRKPTEIEKGSHSTTFAYQPDRSHYKRTDNNGINITTTLNVGSVEFITVDAGPIKTKRYIGGVLIVTDYNGTHEEHALLTDHLGSTVAMAKANSLDLEQMDYDAFGKRRNLWTLNELAQAEASNLNHLTTTGFTGHEMLDEVGLIHMQGRVYDPKLGRFMSADPYITELDNTQNMNRYSYVYNNPLTLIDPNGFNVADPNQYGMSEEDFANAWAYEMGNYNTAMLGMGVFGNSGAGPSFDEAFMMLSQFSADAFIWRQMLQTPTVAASFNPVTNTVAIPISGQGSGPNTGRPAPDDGSEIIDVAGKRSTTSGPPPTTYVVPTNQTTATSSTSAVLGAQANENAGAIPTENDAASIGTTDLGSIEFPEGEEKIDDLFALVKGIVPGIDFGPRVIKKDLSKYGDDVVGLVNPGGVGGCLFGGCIKVDDRFVAQLDLSGMKLLTSTIIHEGLHRTYSVTDNIRMGSDHPQIYAEARALTDAYWSQIEAALVVRYSK
jgi:RHS repeat-associated protein